MPTFRVRSVIDHLPTYEWMVKQNIVPDLSELIVDESKKYPPWVHKKISPFLNVIIEPERTVKLTNGKTKKIKAVVQNETFSTFGLFVEVIVKREIFFLRPDTVWEDDSDSLDEPDFKLPETSLYSIYRRIILRRTGKDIAQIFPVEEFNKSRNYFGGMIEWIRQVYADDQLREVKFNQEISYFQGTSQAASSAASSSGLEWQGHPDIMGHDYILDVKCVANFKSKYQEHFLQVLSYYSIAKRNPELNVSKVGIFLPLQRKVIMFEIEEWLDDVFVDEVFNTARKLFARANQIELMMTRSMALNRVGSHIGREMNDGSTRKIEEMVRIVATERFDTHYPMQIYIGSNRARANDSLFTPSTIGAIRQLVSEFNLRLYVHAPVNINPSKDLSTPELWGIKRIKRELDIGYRLGARGVVLHVGKTTTFSYPKSVNQMESFVRECLSGATEECPLLLETPAGQSGEVCTRFSEFAHFYDRFTPEEKRRFKICIDTCHVFASGYEPSEYIEQWFQFHGPETVPLVHFNDSKNSKGCLVDRHQQCGYGHVGAAEMLKARNLCDRAGIDMVSE